MEQAIIDFSATFWGNTLTFLVFRFPRGKAALHNRCSLSRSFFGFLVLLISFVSFVSFVLFRATSLRTLLRRAGVFCVSWLFDSSTRYGEGS